MNSELLKNKILRLASILDGTSIADSLTVSNKSNLLIWMKQKENSQVNNLTKGVNFENSS